MCLPCRKELAEARKTNKPCGKCCFYLLISKTFVGAGKSNPGRTWRGHGEDELLFAHAEEEFFHEVRLRAGARRGAGQVRASPPYRFMSESLGAATVLRVPQQLQLTRRVAHAGSQVSDERGEETVGQRAQRDRCF